MIDLSNVVPLLWSNHSFDVVSIPPDSNITEGNEECFPLLGCFDGCDKLNALSKTCQGHYDPSVEEPILWYLKSEK